ncbi:MAG: hypothetical protein JXR22_05700 [Prolixibacteraceae bacterium]|nr:hypothetical protein [Prolixibacteraceae bacterium]
METKIKTHSLGKLRIYLKAGENIKLNHKSLFKDKVVVFREVEYWDVE